MLTVIYCYLFGVVAMLAYIGYKISEIQLKDGLFLAFIWPAVLAIKAVTFLLGLKGWTADMMKTDNWFAFRKRPGNLKGFAVTLFTIEYLFWKE